MEDRYQDKKLKERFERLEVTPPAHIWQGVEAGLDKKKGKSRWKKLLVAASIASLTGSAVAFWLMRVERGSFQAPYQAHTISNPVVVDSVVSSHSDESLENLTAQVVEEEKTVVVIYPSPNHSEKENLTSTVEMKEVMENAVVTPNMVPLKLQPLKEINYSSSRNQLKRTSVKHKRTLPFSYNALALAQAKKNQADRDNQWTLEARVSPIVNGAQSSTSSQYRAMEGETSDMMAMGGGVAFGYKKAGSRWGIRSGVNYNRSGQQTQYDGSVMPTGIMAFSVARDAESVKRQAPVDRIFSRAGIVVMQRVAPKNSSNDFFNEYALLKSQSVSPNSLKQEFEFLEVPVEVTYDLLQKGIRLQLTGGMSAHYLLDEHTQVEMYDQQVLPAETTGLRDFSYTGNLGLGMGYELLPRFLLRVEPSFKYFLNSLSSNNSIEYRPYSFGVFTGITYTFK